MQGALDDDKESWGEAPHPTIRLFGRRYRIPRSVLLRRIVGILLVVMGLFGFLPVVGFWMIPLGLIVLSHDSNMIRRWRRRVAVRFGRRNGNGKPR